uniref:Gamma-aminobutyric acid type B receptor subunit 2-like n=1 Tax=Saccoglossus kowalevskii TaxID=10224 RepID=A0ABM0MT97_SACKO|nr:PREDICTED: gamma-aminobutyric acid type B receptor subunit 2-like [Saccoglossus kowalevskii]
MTETDGETLKLKEFAAQNGPKTTGTFDGGYSLTTDEEPLTEWDHLTAEEAEKWRKSAIYVSWATIICLTILGIGFVVDTTPSSSLIHMSWLRCVFVVLAACSPVEVGANKTVLTILGLFPFDSPIWNGGESHLPASQMAMQHINDNEDILADYELQIVSGDSKCVAGAAVNSMYELLYREPTKIFILGPACSAPSEATTQAAWYWSLVQMSYSALSVTLSDKIKFPYFTRIKPPDVALNVARLALIQHYGWNKVATITEAENIWLTGTNDMIEKMTAAGMEVATSETFREDPRLQMENIKSKDVRIIYGNFYAPASIKVFCEAYRLGMYGAKYVWIARGGISRDSDRDIDTGACTFDQILEVMEGMLSVGTCTINPEKTSKGVSGMSHIIFNENGDAVPDLKYQQYQDGVRVDVGIYQSKTGIITFDADNPVIWKGGEPPNDHIHLENVILKIPFHIYVLMSSCAFIGITCALCFLVFNLKYRHKRIIKMSSPTINNIILVGCIVTYLTVFMSAFESAQLESITYCKLSTYLLMIGFSTAYGGLFSKTWRVHVLFTNKELKKKTTEFDNYITTYMVEVCESSKMEYWLVVIYSTKAILMLLGAFLAWETRTVSISILNDSHYIGICIYNVVLLSVLGAPLAYLLRSQPKISYIITSAFVIVGTTVTQCLVFVPKIIAYKDGQVIPWGTRSIRKRLDTFASNSVDTGQLKVSTSNVAVQCDLYTRIIGSADL